MLMALYCLSWLSLFQLLKFKFLLLSDIDLLATTFSMKCGYFSTVCAYEGSSCVPDNANECTDTGVVVAEVQTIDLDGCEYPVLDTCVCEPLPSQPTLNVTIVHNGTPQGNTFVTHF